MPASFSDLSSGDLINCVRATIHGVIVAVIALAAFASRAAGAPLPSAPAGLQPTGLAQSTRQAESVVLPIAPIPIPEIALCRQQIEDRRQPCRTI